MALSPPGPRRERILLYGQPGAGKSYAWTQVAEWLHKTQGVGKLWVIDTDLAWDAMRPVDGHLDDRVNVYPIYEWDDYKPAVTEIREKAGKDDWFVIDLADVVWDAAQEGWSQKVEGEDIDEFFLRHQIAGSSPGGDYGSNWVQIKRMYRGAGINLISRFRGHVLCCASASVVRAKDKSGKFGDDAEIVDKYGKLGWKPNGQDKLAHLFHTEILMSDSPSGYRMSTAKDRGRDKMNGEKVSSDFVTAYLIGRAGWKP